MKKSVIGYKVPRKTHKPTAALFDSGSGGADGAFVWFNKCGCQTEEGDITVALQPKWNQVTCNRCLQIAYRAKLKELIEITTQANIISCNLTTFHTLRDFERLATLAQRNRNLFVANNEEE